MWDAIAATVRAEFSDLSDITDLTRLLVRIVLAMALTAVLGFERERRGSSAGLRTHMLVALGVVIVTIAAEQSGMGSEAVSRVIQGVFAGVGFIGAGAIIKQSDKEEVHGLTTAGSIWATAAIATAAGLGQQSTAIISTAFALVILALLLRLERALSNNRDR